jgi:hypothetical protein
MPRRIVHTVVFARRPSLITAESLRTDGAVTATRVGGTMRVV